MPQYTDIQISVVVPTFERKQALADCLHALAAQIGVPGAYEVIVVNDGGAVEPLDEVTREFESRLDLRIVSQPNSGPAAARNFGAELAKYGFIAFTDDDCLPAPDWLQHIAEALSDAPDAMVGGKTENEAGGNIYSAASQMILDLAYEYHNRASQDAGLFGAANIAMAAENFRKLGGFDSNWPVAAAEDREFCERWRSSGLAMVYAPDAVVLHNHRLSLRKFWRQQEGYGRGAFHFHRVRQQRGGEGVRPDTGFYKMMLAYPIQHARGMRALAVIALFGVWQFANAYGYWQESRRWKIGRGVKQTSSSTDGRPSLHRPQGH